MKTVTGQGGVSAAGAFRVAGSNDFYTVYDIGSGAPNGVSVSGVATDWCNVEFAVVGTKLVGGVYLGG